MYQDGKQALRKEFCEYRSVTAYIGGFGRGTEARAPLPDVLFIGLEVLFLSF
jgi:hypothetical protein